MDEKTFEHIGDITSSNLSDCCGAPIVMEDICSDCKEHCEPMEEDEE